MKILVFILGTIIGSFLSLCVYRIPREQSIIYPHSRCTNCNNKIKWRDLIPVFSYILLKGKCRYCNHNISPQYFIIEVITGILFILLYIKYGFGLMFVKYAAFLSIVLLIAVIDIYTMNVYFNTIIAGIGASSIFLLVEYYMGYDIKTFIYGGIAAGLFIVCLILLTGGMGFGDAEVCIIAGLFLGFKLVLLMIIISFFIGTLAGIILIALDIKSRKDFIPFIPFITASSIITVLLGNTLMRIYISTVYF
ncbi:MAG: prepilin peptidase [Clostridium sp.]|jgi:leader peptidase (prepilin peptidase)/N-methyltransferase|uniref:prepilin peptidase n=1 Tax=Clostridium sp. TaxID=1506 RepID=UPI0025BC200E|nr:A24 family peptidase [Clostridium sp.]MCH3962710.1 prepilin peptidase [Clostridium sp.]MCI1715876.1 prepilin peptidase [Clostridium sp.]MCI1799920.1 prepilin peptidase [Clostridium sp.]MCI1813834.1 prepilin peptidase [Clostridium sp.]MCI1870732.1 prepilin peptidase [Clostridium sp.]